MFWYKFLFRSIGPRSRIYSPMMLVNTEFARIGTGVLIRKGVRIECIHMEGCSEPELIIDDFTNIEQNVHIICRSRMRIGKNVTITGNCAIVDVVHPYSDVENPVKPGARIDFADRPVEIDDYSFVGYGSIILPGVRIGRRCVIGAGSVVTQDVPDFCVATGAPAKIVRRFDPESKRWSKVLD